MSGIPWVEPIPSRQEPSEFRAATRRGIWVFLDQGVSSLTNLGLSFLILRTGGAAGFGAFTIAYTTYIFAIMISRALASEPQVVRFSHSTDAIWRKSTKHATGLACVLGAIAGLLLLIVSQFLSGSIVDSLLPLSLSLPGLLLQDAWRFAFFAAGKPSKAFTNDVVWALAEVVFVGGVLLANGTSTGRLVAAWGGAGVVAALYGLLQARVLPEPKRWRRWINETRDLGPKFALEFIVDRGASQVLLFVVGVVSGLAALGSLNAARVLFGPFSVVYMGAIGFGVPEGVRIWQRSPQRLEYTAQVVSVTLATAVLVFGALLFTLTASLGTKLVGSAWQQVRELLPFTAVWVAAVGIAQAPRMGLRVFAASRQSLTTRTQAAVATLLAGILGALLWGAIGAAAGLALGQCVGAWLWWGAFRKEYKLLMNVSSKTDPESDYPLAAQE